MLHGLIRTQNITEVKSRFTRELADCNKYIYNKQNESAVAVALISGHLEIYKVLIQRNFKHGPHENLRDLISNLSQTQKQKLTFIHVESSIPNYLGICFGQCTLFHAAPSKLQKRYFDKIRNALNELDEIEWIALMLEFLALSGPMKMVFDFNEDSVVDIDPVENENTKGKCYFFRGNILIGARGLLTDRSNEVMGTLAHEISHLALERLYENDCKPYNQNDQLNEMNFHEVVLASEENQDEEKIIKLVFSCYTADYYHAELIVRVPHILGSNFENPVGTIRDLERNFPALLDYFKKVVCTDLMIKLIN